MTPYQLHKTLWSQCQLCTLCEVRKHVCHVRGKLPADVLFVGEAPGPSEDVLGSPFTGPAGQLLDEIVGDALRMCGREVTRCAFANLVGCIPLDDERKKFSEPQPESIKACEPRLSEIVEMARPKLVVAVGSLAAKWLRKRHAEYGIIGIPIVDVLHPAFILRSPDVGQPLLVKKVVVTLASAVEDVS